MNLKISNYLKISTDDSTYGDDATGNKGILKALERNDDFIEANGTCNFDNDVLECNVGDNSLKAYADGLVSAGFYSEAVGFCHNMTTAGKANCYRYYKF